MRLSIQLEHEYDYGDDATNLLNIELGLEATES